MYIGFTVCALIIVVAGWYLAYYGDIIAEKSGLGRSFIGLIGVAAITSLPELITTTSAVVLRDAPELAFSNVFGSNMFNILIVAILEIFIIRKPFLYLVSKKNIATIGFIFLATFSVLLGFEGYSFEIRWISFNSILILIIYLAAMYTGFKNSKDDEEITDLYGDKNLKKAIYLFIILGIIIIISGTFGTIFADEIAVETGLGRTFVGGLFLAVMTSLPELITGLSAIKLKAYNMIVGNLLGSNMFNIAILFICDIVYADESIFLNLKQTQFLPVVFSLILLSLMLIGMIRNKESYLFKKKVHLETIFILLFYILGIFLIYKL
ncbi:MAG: hypothetical protein FXF47_02570 [Candidatus Mcinerneyibacterium aminivorans]|uniref:Sodium/calcium exchanger membrane region domain-containing protein n=1 Tax=Candidatus Mcinerneyibacterium aminivorans TaxID=2703815 RepID=A0A5D0MDC9_9BACT|nr:MAG: hypothetical protein FXF47_02570 [Candidatus Mcinerneyibacterium aminivorans]